MGARGSVDDWGAMLQAGRFAGSSYYQVTELQFT
jgi:hypothetical protein